MIIKNILRSYLHQIHLFPFCFQLFLMLKKKKLQDFIMDSESTIFTIVPRQLKITKIISQIFQAHNSTRAGWGNIRHNLIQGQVHSQETWTKILTLVRVLCILRKIGQVNMTNIVKKLSVITYLQVNKYNPRHEVHEIRP